MMKSNVKQTLCKLTPKIFASKNNIDFGSLATRLNFLLSLGTHLYLQ